MDKSEIYSGFHVGGLLLNGLKRWRQDDICQIDVAIGESENAGSLLRRCVRLARGLRRRGFSPGDLLALSGRNHINLRIPYYAALLNGLPVLGVDPSFKYDEIKRTLENTRPKIVFCDSEMYEHYVCAAKDLGIDLEIISFGDGGDGLAEFIEKHDDNAAIDDFEPATINVEKVYCWIIASSGSTGAPKFSAITHKNITLTLRISLPHLGVLEGIKKILFLSPVQWVTSYAIPLGCIMSNICLIQTSQTTSIEQYIDIINDYKPNSTMASPSFYSLIMKNENKYCDLTCFDNVVIGGAKVHKQVADELRSRVREGTEMIEIYSQTEVACVTFATKKDTPPGSLGPLISPYHSVKLMDAVSDEEITQPYTHGELWIKGPMFTEYYRSQKETAAAFSEDGWLKTGDLMYRDESNNYYFVERLKMLIKFKNYCIIPPEIEDVILTLPGVKEVAVTSVPHSEDGQHPVACVVRRAGYDVSAQEVKLVVLAKLSDAKQIRGGVIFLDELPKTSNGKPARTVLHQLALNTRRE